MQKPDIQHGMSCGIAASYVKRHDVFVSVRQSLGADFY